MSTVSALIMGVQLAEAALLVLIGVAVGIGGTIVTLVFPLIERNEVLERAFVRFLRQEAAGERMFVGDDLTDRPEAKP
jgi:hypothetical protein